MILSIRHPVPVRVVPRGGRVERLAFVARQSMVLLEERPEGAFTAAPGGRMDRDRIELGLHEEDTDPVIWAGEGRLWLRADGTTRRRDVSLARGARGPDALLRLAGSRRPSGWTTLERHLHRTPFRGWHGLARKDAAGDMPGVRLGADTPPPGRVVEDLSDAAGAALARYLERDVRLSGGALFVAFEGLHRVMQQAHDTHPTTAFTRPVLTVAPRFLLSRIGDLPFCVRADRDQAWSGFPKRLELRESGPPNGAQRRLMEMSASLEGDADVSAHANELPGRVIHLVERSGGTKGAGKVDLDPLLRWAALGSVGAVAPEDEHAALADVARAVRQALAHAGRGPTRSRLGDVLAYVEEVAMPLSAGPAPEGADAGAMAGLGA